MHLRKRADTISLPEPPTVVNPSGQFDGNDGKWSSFSINVNSDNNGENGQNFRVLISTSSPLTLLPMQVGWCDDDCAARRGALLYNGKQPQGLEFTDTWKQSGFYNIPIPYWYPDTFMNSTSNQTLGGLWGLTNVGLGESSAQSPVLAQRNVVGYYFEDFFMGSFGLAAGEVGPTSGTRATFLSQYELDRRAPSSSYGYAAGAYYRKCSLFISRNVTLWTVSQAKAWWHGYQSFPRVVFD